MVQRAIILLSGGLDSCVAACIAKERGYEIYVLSFDYGQRHKKELLCALRIGEHLGVKKQKILKIDLPERSFSALTDGSLAVPRDRGNMSENIPVTYVPARNTIFVSYALSWSEVMDADAIFIGANAVDFSGYPDCRNEYIGAWNDLIKVGMKNNSTELIAPLIAMSKREIIERGRELGAPFELTWSCYEGGDKSCGRCDSCRLRLKGFGEAGLRDPLEYETGV